MGFFSGPTGSLEVLFSSPEFLFACDNVENLVYGYEWTIVAQIDRSIMTNLLLAEQALREYTQREETLRYRAKALQKATAITSTAITSDNTQLQEANKQLEEAKSHYPKKEHALYRAESMLEPNTKRLYDKVRCNTMWFMREEMVQDCSDRGGCCSRQCGCCAQRHLSERQKGRGHCTFECWCCISFRGFDLPEEEKEEIRKDFGDRLLYLTSQYLLKLATWFICPMKRERSKLQQILGLG